MNTAAKSPMTILCLEFSSERRSAAIVCDGRVLAESSVIAGRTTSAPGLIAAVLKESGLTPTDVSRLAIGIGPGSYTGIRRAIATVQGWHLAHGTPVVPVGSFQTLALLAAELDPGPLWLAADAQRGEWAVAPADGARLTGELRLVRREDLAAWIVGGQRVVTPDATLTGATRLYPSAAQAALLAQELPPMDPSNLAPAYLREASFVKAPPSRWEAE